MAVNSKKVDVNSLVKGMYISRLDRPWIETSYPIEGFYIQDDNDIRQLRNQCRSVYIDVDLTKLHIDISEIAVNPGTNMAHTSLPPAAEAKKTQQLRKTLKAQNPLYTERTPFEKEFKTASKLYETVIQGASEVLREITSEKAINVKKIHQTAGQMVDSIIRNPDAFLWLSRLRAKDTHSHNRSVRAAIWAIAFGRHLSLSKKELNELSIAVLLSNIGKARLPRELLEKSEQLHGEALKSYQKHVQISVQLLKKMAMFSSGIINTIAAHCERYDGSGYPRQLAGEAIPFPAQIAGLVSYYEKLTNQRISQNSLDATRAMEHLYQLRDKKFQSELIEEFIQSIGIYPAGSLIELNSREVAVIVEQNEQQRLLPTVIILRDAQKKPVKKLKILDLSSLQGRDGSRPKIINSIPLGSYNIDSEEIINCISRIDRNWAIKKLFN